jgi:oxaloacetate decarboxylase gamma subunit
MSEALNDAIKILLVGMTTVFFILLIVVFVGNILIDILNKTDFILNRKESKRESEIPGDVKRAIAKAIEKWSDANAKITDIRKSGPDG